MGARHSLRTKSYRFAGVTLTEVVVASALLLVAILPLLKALTAAHVMDRAIERKSWSLLLAERELERIRAGCDARYDQSFQASSVVMETGYLCTVFDDAHTQLRTITVSVGLDRDGDSVLSSEEVEVSLCTRMARR